MTEAEKTVERHLLENPEMRRSVIGEQQPGGRYLVSVAVRLPCGCAIAKTIECAHEDVGLVLLDGYDYTGIVDLSTVWRDAGKTVEAQIIAVRENPAKRPNKPVVTQKRHK